MFLYAKTDEDLVPGNVYFLYEGRLPSVFTPEDGRAGVFQQADFAKTFGAILRLRNVLPSWDQFEGDDEHPGDDPIDPKTLQDY